MVDEDTADRGSRFQAVLDSVMGQTAGPRPDMVCGAALLRLGTSGVGITVAVSEQLLQNASAAGTGHVGDGIQAELGEGPAYAAHVTGWPALAADLATDDRWPAFALAAGEAGIRASFSFPIRSGEVRLGTMNLYRGAADPLSDGEYADALIFARLALDMLTAPGVAGEPTSASNGHALLGGGRSTPQVHQATGMVSIQLGIDVAGALAALRARAYASECNMSDIAADVVARRLHFGEDT
ncbi:MAG: GAF domain-containing protein [Nitriliruptoraceae bacterium]